MTEAFLHIKWVCTSFQEECCVGMAPRMEVEQRHAQLLVNNAIGVLQANVYLRWRLIEGINAIVYA